MDPFEDPDHVEAAEQAGASSASAAAPASAPAVATAPPPSDPVAHAQHVVPSSDKASAPFVTPTAPNPDLHASAAIFGEGAGSHDDHQLQDQSVQLSTLNLGPPALGPHAQSASTATTPLAELPPPNSTNTTTGSSGQAASSSATGLADRDPHGPSSGRPGNHRHRHRRPSQPSTSSAGDRRRTNSGSRRIPNALTTSQSGGGLSATLSSLRRNISRQIEKERQNMGLSKSNLRDVYIPPGSSDEEGEEQEDVEADDAAEGDRLLGARRSSKRPSVADEEDDPDPEDIISPEQTPRTDQSAAAGSSSSSQRKGKSKSLSSSRSQAGRGRMEGSMRTSTSSVGARRRAMRVMTAKEKAFWLWANVENMDGFLAEVYAYYQGKGLYCIALSRTLNLLTIAFVIFFSTFLLGCVDYSSIKHDGSLSDVIVPQCVNHLSSFAVMLLFLLGGGFIWLVFRFGVGISRLVAMHGFYEHLLGIPDADVQAIPWHEVVNRISALRISNPQDPSLVHNDSGPSSSAGAAAATNKKRLGLDAHDIANRIMRQNNYLIALFNKDVLNLSVPLQLPLPSVVASILGLQQGQHTGDGSNANGSGQNINSGVLGGPKPVLTKSLEWNLHFCLLGFFFDQDGQLNQAVLRDRNRDALVAGLRQRLITMAIMNAILAPFIVLYLLFFSFFRYFEEYHKNPANLGSRQYTEYARWKFREFNELPHLFKRRMQSSMPFAQRYVDQFPKERLVILARFVAFIAGSFTAVLLLASLFDPDLFLHFEITPQRNTLFYIGIFGGVLAVARGMIPEENVVVDPELEIREVIRRTHYYPDEWRGRLHSAEVHADFGTMYTLKVYVFLTEMVSVIMTPFILWLSLPQSAPAIVDFFREFTVHVDGLGYVCSFAVFDFKRHGNVRFGAPTQSRDERMASKAGKMEQSFLNFKVANPDWLPADPSGSLFLSRLTETVARHQHQVQRSRNASGAVDPYGSPTLDAYSTASFLHHDMSGTAGSTAESTLAARRHLYDEAFNRSILLASKPQNAEALAASATKSGPRSANRSQSNNIGASGTNARSRSASGRGGTGRALQVVDEDGDIFGEQVAEDHSGTGEVPGAGRSKAPSAPVDLLASLPPRAMEDSVLDAPFHSFVGDDFTAVPSTSTSGNRHQRRQGGGKSASASGGGNSKGEQELDAPLDEQGFKALLGNLYRGTAGPPASRSVW
ncbi:autophagy protein atg9 [Tilletia horrida]|nr:autophagy protein atg9 [Tilletia horrida]